MMFFLYPAFKELARTGYIMSDESSIEAIITKHVLLNALKYDGKAQVGSVLGSIMGDHKELRPKAREIKPKVVNEVNRVNAMGIDAIKTETLDLGIDVSLLNGKHEEKKGLPPLPGLDGVKVPTFRLAPFPSGPLHIGNARMVILNDEYAKLTNGKLILCFDDTIGTTKKKLDAGASGAKFILPEAYDMIREGLEWLGVEWDEEVYKSDRLEIYNDYCQKLIEQDNAYTCTCTPADFKKFKDGKQPCPHRQLRVSESLEGWRKMIDGEYGEGDAVIRLKTGMDLDDPALRDPVIMRISWAPHPRIGNVNKVWPMLEFSWAIDDHLLGITHIIRGKDLLKEDYIERFIWDIFKWKHSEIMHHGLLSLGFKLSKTRAREKVKAGEYSGWSDPRIWSMQSLEKRGIQPEAIRKTLVDMGISMTDVDFPYKILYAENQKIIDKESDRFFFVEDPVMMEILGIPKEEYIAKPLVNPLVPTKGYREIPIKIQDGSKEIFVSRGDFKTLKSDFRGKMIRLKDLINVILDSTRDERLFARYLSDDLESARNKKAKIIHWVDTDPKNHVKVSIMMADGALIQGFGEKNLLSCEEGQLVQFERFCFAKIQSVNESEIRAFFTH
ncbi:glutamate--tRNA ligase [Candidatus Bathyarchaeota archaeon]|nr:glutamate--tRNA ligase [Candidatus Bathyarchaeota archaeon]